MASWPVRWLLLFRLFGMHRCGHACVLACFVGLEAWLVAAALTDSMPMLRRLYITTFPNTPDKLSERAERAMERGRERKIIRSCSAGFWQAGWQALGWPVGSLCVWLDGCLFEWQGPGLPAGPLDWHGPEQDARLAGRMASPGFMVGCQADCLSAFLPHRPPPLLKSRPACVPHLPPNAFI